MGAALSYAHGTAAVPLRGQTIGRAWLAAVAEHASRDALVARHQGVRLTYGELAAEVERAARALLAAGVERGDRVGLWSPNRYEWPVVQLAAARAGAILVSLNPAYRARELGYALEQSGTSLLVMAEGFRGVDYRETLAASGARPRRTVTLGPEWEALLAEGDRVPAAALAAREAELDVDDPASIQYTSGTTGFPKGATLSHHNMLNNGFFVGRGSATGPLTGSACPCRSTTASAWCSGRSRVSRTAPRWCCRARRSSRRRRSRLSMPRRARRSTGCRRCSSRSSRSRASLATTCARSAPG